MTTPEPPVSPEPGKKPKKKQRPTRKPTKAMKFSEATVETALRASGGIYSRAAKRLKCVPNTVKKYVDNSEYLQGVIAETKEVLIDMAEDGLQHLIRKRNLGAICFYLKTQAKQRGYVERSEMTGANGAPLGVPLTDLDELRRRMADNEPEPTPEPSPEG